MTPFRKTIFVSTLPPSTKWVRKETVLRGEVCVTLLDMDQGTLNSWAGVPIEQSQKDMISTCLFGDGNLMNREQEFG